MLDNKILPHNLNAEMAVLGAILMDNTKIYNAMEILKEDDFYKIAHRKIYNTMIKMSIANTAIDLVTLTDTLSQEKELSNVGGGLYLTTLLNSVPTAENIQYYIDIVKEKSILRRMITSSQKIIQLGYEGKEVREIIGESQEIMFDCFKDELNNDMKFYSIGDLLQDSFTSIENFYQNKGGTGLKIPFPDLNNILGGLQKQELYILAGDTSQGKTSLAMDIGYSLAKLGAPVAFFSIEMGKENIMQRLICSRARVDYNKMRNGYLSEQDWPKLTTASGEMVETPFYINDFSIPTVFEIIAMARKMILHKGVKLIIIDFLQQIYHNDKKSPTEQVTQDVKLIKGLTKSLNIPVILLSSLSRRTNYKEPPTLSTLRQSGAIESAADNVIFVYRPEAYAPTLENNGIAEIHIAKQRNGPTGMVKLAFIKQYTRFENLGRVEE